MNLIVALSENNIIGVNNTLPWKQTADLKNFKEVTYGKIVVMGRYTWESLPQKPLFNRENIILSQTKNISIIELYPSVRVINDLASIKATFDYRKEDVFFIGGETIYKLVMEKNWIRKIYLTKIHAEIEGDKQFDLPTTWNIEDKGYFEADNENEYPYSFHILTNPNE